MTRLTRQYSAFLPDFCGVRMAVAVILIAELLAIVLTLADLAAGGSAFETLALNSLFIQWVALGCIALLCLLRSRLNRLPDVWSAALSYLIMLAVTLLVTEIAWWLLFMLPGERTLLETGHGLFLGRCLGISAIVSALALRYFYVQHQWRRHVQSEAEARLQALQARIRPHFLFNCMNTIASLTRREPLLAEQAIEDLADLFRLNLQESKPWVTVAEELDLCQRYLRIEQLRLSQRLRVEWDISALPADACIPALVIQPLLENAVYHGIEPQPDGGCIHIRGDCESGQLGITIDNPLPVQRGSRHQGNQVAQENTRQRLASAFAERGRLTSEQHDGRYRTRVVFPEVYEPCAS